MITFDLFSALLDSASGAASVFDEFARDRTWLLSGSRVYVAWDARNKELQKSCTRWVPFAALAEQALADTYARHGLPGDARQDCATVLASMAHWPPWPDVMDGLSLLRQRYAIGVLSNVDDDLLRTTQIWTTVDHELAFTSERLGCYKPDPRIYRSTAALCDLAAHVAASARDVRGAVEAGIPVVRLARTGHVVDPAGPVPEKTAATMYEIDSIVSQALSDS